ncbi:MAG TPA: DUF4263 domain-containing protein [Firmicutes bacterium]|nr:DUF4263 domain-containing protein [Bacillota bacterium]
MPTDDFITDFVIQRINNEYIVVELESSTDRLFTQKGSLTSGLTEATGQVRDFQSWITDNLAYAQTKLPGIRHPEGLIVLGRRDELDDSMSKRLDEENLGRRGPSRLPHMMTSWRGGPRRQDTI